MGARQKDRKREEDGERKQKVGQLHVLSSRIFLSYSGSQSLLKIYFYATLTNMILKDGMLYIRDIKKRIK